MSTTQVLNRHAAFYTYAALTKSISTKEKRYEIHENISLEKNQHTSTPLKSSIHHFALSKYFHVNLNRIRSKMPGYCIISSMCSHINYAWF